jgi:ATP-dependent Clp protease, protease subunit
MAAQGPPMQQPQGTIYVSFSAGINTSTAEALIAVMADCAKKKVSEVILFLSTEGGSVMAGINLYNILIGMPFKLLTHNVGSVDSIGNAIFLAGEERYACPHSTFMFHGVARDFNGRLSAKEAREIMGSLLADEARISSIVEQRSKLSQADIQAFFGEARTMNAEGAVSAGIADHIKDARIPQGATMITVTVQR